MTDKRGVILTRSDAAHLLRRTGFGATPAAIAELTGMALEVAVERVLDDSRNPAAVTPAFLSDPTVNEWEKWVGCVHWWFDRMMTVPAPITEKMTLFWHGLFPSSQDKLYDMGLLFGQNQTYRSLALGDHRQVVQAMAIDPAMIVYLDNETNRAGREQENFAREVMELFTLGVGNYTESDVIAMAKAWTGHNLSDDGRSYLFRPTRHDNAAKTLFGITRNWDGPAALTEILDGSKRDVAARYLVTRLWSFLAAPNPSPALVGDLTTIFLVADHNIKTLLRAMLLRAEFFSPEVRNGLVRSPIEWIVAGMQAVGLNAETCHPEWYMERLGQQPFSPPNVAGWKQNAAWISSAGAWARAGWARYARWRTSEAGVFANVHTLSAVAAAQMAFDRFGITDPSPTTRSAIEAWCSAERVGANRWAMAPNLVVLLLMTPDFQLA